MRRGPVGGLRHGLPLGRRRRRGHRLRNSRLAGIDPVPGRLPTPTPLRLPEPVREPAGVIAGAALPAALAVARPRAASSLDTERIAVVRGGSGFDYFAGVRWSDPAPQMLQQLLVEALVADGRFATAVAAPSRVPAEFMLDVELREFAAFYETEAALPRARVQWQATLWLNEGNAMRTLRQALRAARRDHLAPAGGGESARRRARQ